jgi:hypothetical protein
MLIFILGILLVLLLFNYMPRSYREGVTTQDYDEASCQSIAKQNQNNIDLLQEDVTKLLALQTKIDTIQGQIDANTKQLTTLADQVTKMPQ